MKKLEEKLMDELLDGLKNYGKIEWDDEDELLGMLISAARDTLEAAGVSKDNATSLYRLAVERLAMHYYEHREEVGTGAPVPMGLNWMIEHLRLGDAL